MYNWKYSLRAICIIRHLVLWSCYTRRTNNLTFTPTACILHIHLKCMKSGARSNGSYDRQGNQPHGAKMQTLATTVRRIRSAALLQCCPRRCARISAEEGR